MLSAILQPAFRVVYQGVDITTDFAPYITGVSYTDKRHGESDEATLNLQNTDGKWLDAWAPEDGDVFELWYGYADAQVYAGRFTIDEWSVSGDTGGDTVEIKGLATPKSQALRTKNTVAYESQTLSQIVEKVAAKHGLTVDGAIEDISFDRVTQYGERDLEFLKRLADDYGHYFTVKGTKLVFTSRDGLRAREPVMIIDRTTASQSLNTYELRKADHVASQQATVKYLNPRRKAVVGQSVTSADDLGVMTASGDIVKIDVRVENEIQAKRVAKSRLDKKNAQKMTGSLTFVGTPVLVAGAVVELAGFGVFNGRYLITQSEHKMERSGYETSIDIEHATDKNIKDGKSAKTMKKGDAIDDLGIIDSDGVLSREEKQ